MFYKSTLKWKIIIIAKRQVKAIRQQEPTVKQINEMQQNMEYCLKENDHVATNL